MKLAGIAFTERGARLLERLLSRFQEEGEETEGTVSPSCAEAAGGLSIRRETLKEWTKRQFQQADGLIFVGAAGIAVRACAPFVQDKTKDPAVIVIDETGQYAVSLLSGHLGGANELARQSRIHNRSGAGDYDGYRQKRPARSRCICKRERP